MPEKQRSKILLPILIVAIVILALLAVFLLKPKSSASPTPTPQPEPTATPSPTPFPEVEMVPVLPEMPSVYQTLSDYFIIGAAIEPYQLDDGQHAYMLTHHFNGVTPENVMKALLIQPTEGNFDFAAADHLVQFAQAHNLTIHGHTLVWHNQVPDWFFNDASGQPLPATPESKELVLSRLETHIRTLVGRYAGKIDVWDAVNEAIDPSYPDCMRRSKWFELTGTDYITTAFRVAHEVDPNAKLIINDWGTDDPARQECLYNLVNDLLAQGVQVDGVGHQFHVNIESPSAANIDQTILRFADLGLLQYVTELDMSVYPNDTDTYSRVPKDILILQGHRYKDIFEVFKKDAQYIESVTFWGMADDHSWLKTFPISRINLPLLFDEELQPKYAYWGIIDPSPENLPMLIQKVNIAKASPVIDAIPELLWSQQPWITIPGTNKLTASFQTRWDETNLYLFVDIKGAPEDLGKIEVFIDENKNKTTTYEADDRHYTFVDGVCQDCEGVVSAVATEDGYQLEASLPFVLRAARDAQMIGFDIRVTEADQPDTLYSWNDLTNNQDTDTSQFGTLTLAASSQLTTAKMGTPVIDGEEDTIWADAEEISTDVWATGSDGATAKVKTLWDAEYLYVYAVVTDAVLSDASLNAYEQDSIEVFIDQNNAKTTTYEADDAQYRINFNNVQTYNGDAKVELIQSAAKIVPGGYVVELSIKFDAIQPEDGMLIGFDFQVNDDGAGDGTRSSISKWNDPTNNSYINTSKFGLLQFVN